MPSLIPRFVTALPTLARNFPHPIVKRLRHWLSTRRRRSTSGGRSSRPPTSRPNESRESGHRFRLVFGDLRPTFLLAVPRGAPLSLSTTPVAPLVLPCHGWAGEYLAFSLCSETHERPLRQ